MIKADAKMNFNFPKIVIKDDLRYVAEKIIIPVMQKNIDSEVALDGSPQTPIEDKTIKNKIRKGLSPKVLTETGTLRTAFIVQDAGESSVKVTINSKRKDIGRYLQLEGIRSNSGRKFFNFFGISTIMEKNAIAYMKKRIKDILKNGK
jgi:hypothetical protein